MTKKCWIESCRDRAEAYCCHCSYEVCHYHFMEHKNWLQGQLLPLIKEVNIMFNQLQRCDMDQSMFTLKCLSNARRQLDQWRSDTVHHIDDIYDRALQQMTISLEKHKQEVMTTNQQSLNSLYRLRRQLDELLRERDIAYEQLKMMRQQMEEIRSKEEIQNNHPDVRVLTEKPEVEKYVSVIFEQQQSYEELYRDRTMKMPLSDRDPVHISSPSDSDDEKDRKHQTIKKTFDFNKTFRRPKLPYIRELRPNTQIKRNQYRDRIAYANEHTRRRIPA